MRALDPEVVDAVWSAVEPLIPRPDVNHPLGCHRQRTSDRDCFQGILIRLVTGCSWEDAERLMGGKVSDTTLRTRRDEWVTAGVFDRLADEAVAAVDRIIGLDLSDVAVDASIHKAPCGGEGTGPSPIDRRKLGWKWTICTDRDGIPIGWAATGANRNDVIGFSPAFEHMTARGLTVDIESIHMDRSYDVGWIRDTCQAAGIDDIRCAKRRRHGDPTFGDGATTSDPLGMRWAIERTNSWLSNFGQLRRNTDRKTGHRLAQLALAITLIITAKLIDWRNRWSPIR
jgi:transposase